MVAKLPNFAPACKELALLETSPATRLVALKEGLNANPDKDTYGILRLNEALLLHGDGQKSEAIEILSVLVIDRDSTVATSCLAKETLAKLIA